MIYQGPIFLPRTSIHLWTQAHIEGVYQPRSELPGGQGHASCPCLPGRDADVEHHPDAQEELAQHRAQLGDQVELHDLTQVRVIRGGVCPELIITDF